MTWIKSHSKGSIIHVYVQPGASKSELCGEHDGRPKIRIKAPPRDGEANASLIEFLSGILKIPKSRIHLLQGESSRSKMLLVELSPDEVKSYLLLDR